MPLIKRYPNRKLYDTDAKRYVTLEELAALVQQGTDVHVVDHESGEDLTNLTLTQIVLDQQRKSAGSLPRSILTGLIRGGGNTLEQLIHSVQNSVSSLSSLTITSNAQEAEAQVVNMLQQVTQGKLSLEQFQSLLRVNDRMADLLHMLNIPSRHEVQQLQDQLEQLNQKLTLLIELRSKQLQTQNAEKAEQDANA
jgi:polyhydroxyalkanoate synthesis repressor PhaR